MITAEEAELSQASWEWLRDTYGANGTGGDVRYRFLLEAYAPFFPDAYQISDLPSDLPFDAINCGDVLVHASIKSATIIAVCRLASEDEGDQSWTGQMLSDTYDTSISPTLAASGDTVRLFYYDGSNIKYRESLDNGENWDAVVTVGALASVESIAATSLTRVHVVYKTTTKENHRLAVYNYTDSWEKTDSHVRWPLPIGTMDAVAFGDEDIIAVAADFPPLLGRQLVRTTLAWKVSRVTGLAIFVYKNGRWSDHLKFDVVDRYDDRRRSYPYLSYSDGYLFMTYLRKEGDYNTHTSTVTSRSKDGQAWELPAPMTADLNAGAILIRRGDHVYLVGENSYLRSTSSAFNGETVSDLTLEDLSSYVLGVESNIVQVRNTTVQLANPDNVLGADGTLLDSGLALQARLFMGYDDDGEAVLSPVTIADVGGIERTEELPADRITLALADRLSVLGIIKPENAHEWPSQQIGADNFHDPTDTGYGGLGHCAVQSGGWETTDYNLKLRSSNEEGVVWATQASNVFCGEASYGIKFHYHDHDEYVGVCFWAVDKDNLWYAAYHKDEATLYIVERQDGEDTARASVGLFLAIDTYYYIKVRMTYGYIQVYTSTNGKAWTERLTYERVAIEEEDYEALDGLPLTCGWCGAIAYGYTPNPSYLPSSPPIVIPYPTPEPPEPEGVPAAVVMTTNHVAVSRDWYTMDSPMWEPVEVGLGSAGTFHCIDVAPTGQAYLVTYDAGNLSACGLFYCADIFGGTPQWSLLLSIAAARAESGYTDEFESVAAAENGRGYVVFTSGVYPTERTGYWYVENGVLSAFDPGNVAARAIPDGLQYSLCRSGNSVYASAGSPLYESAGHVIKFPEETYVKATYGVNPLRRVGCVSAHHAIGNTTGTGSIYNHAVNLDTALYTAAYPVYRLLEIGDTPQFMYVHYSADAYHKHLYLDDAEFKDPEDVFGADNFGAGFDVVGDTPDEVLWLCDATDPGIAAIVFTQDRGETWTSKFGNWGDDVGDWQTDDFYKPMVRIVEI